MSDYYGHITKSDGTRVHISKEEAAEIWQSVKRGDEDRAKRMPTSEDAMRMILDAQQRMNALGWRKGLSFDVKRGDSCAVREDGSTGIWSGRVDMDGEYVNYCGGVSRPRMLWLKPISELTDDERRKMAECDKDEREWRDRVVQSLITQEEGK